jgi:hypothetical protein
VLQGVGAIELPYNNFHFVDIISKGSSSIKWFILLSDKVNFLNENNYNYERDCNDSSCANTDYLC